MIAGEENARSIVELAELLPCPLKKVTVPWGVMHFRSNLATSPSRADASGSTGAFGPPQDGWWRLKSPRRSTSTGVSSQESSLSSIDLTSGRTETRVVGSSHGPWLLVLM